MHHALSHHPYTNCIVDAETNQLRPSIDFYPTTEKRSLMNRVVARVALATTNAIAIPSLTLHRLIKVSIAHTLTLTLRQLRRLIKASTGNPDPLILPLL